MKTNLKQLSFFLFIMVSLGVHAQTPYSNVIKGKVTCDGKGIQGVVVTDGFRCVQTTSSGEYAIPSLGDARFVYISTPSGYQTSREATIPQFYHEIDHIKSQTYNFELKKNPMNDDKHMCIVQADVQLTSTDDLESYKTILDDCNELMKKYPKTDIFGIDCGDIVGDTPSLYPDYIRTVKALDIPIYRAIGNHDMDYYGRTYETSYRTFENYFGPSCYSFNKGKAHYIVVNNNFYIGREYFYMGYVDEKTFSWIEQDLSFIPKGSLVFLIMHIPSQLKEKKETFQYNYDMIADQTTNAGAVHALLENYNAHLITGHMHYNLNINFSDKLMEHNTAAVCGTWWRAEVCIDGTPQGYGVYEVEGDQVKWYYKSSGYPREYQFRGYAKGASKEYPSDVIANVWNWDKNWKVEWMEDGKVMGEMIHYTGYDPYAEAVCADKEKVKYDWISPVTTEHLFRATPHNTDAKIQLKVTDCFGHIYTQSIENK